ETAVTNRNLGVLTPDPLSQWKEGDKLPASTLYERTRLDDQAEGAGAAPTHHNAKVKAGLIPDASYPPAAGFHNDAAALAACNGPDPLGYDIEAAPVVGEPFEQARAAEWLANPIDLNADVPSLGDEALQAELVRLTEFIRGPEGSGVHRKWDGK